MRNGVGGEPHTCTMITLTDLTTKSRQIWDIGGSVLAPSPDGRFIYTSSGVYNDELKKLHPQGPGGGGGSFVPAAHGAYFMRLEANAEGGRPFGDIPKSGKISFYLAGNYTPLAHLGGVEGVTTEHISYGSNRDSFTHADRVHFIPNAKLILSIPITNDRVELRRFDPVEAMDKAGIDYLIVTSDPPNFAQLGKRYAYSLEVKSKKGGVKLKLDSGPAGMKLSGERDLVWDVPADCKELNPTVIITVSDATGQELFHTFTISVVDKLPAASRN
jgi:hypothetical protein